MRRHGSPSLIGLARIVLMALSLLTAPLVARGLGPDGRGLYAAATAAFGLAPVLLGVGVPMVVRRRAALDGARVEATLRTVTRILPAVAAIGMAAGWVLSRTALAHLDATESEVFTVSMGTTALFVWVLCVQSVLVARGSYLGIAVLQLTQGAATSILVAGLWVLGRMTLVSVLGVYALATAAAAVVASCFVRPRWRGKGMSLRELAVDGVRFAASQITEVSTTAVPMLLAVVAIGPDNAGMLSVGVTLVLIPTALGYVLAPVVFASVSTGDDGERRHVKTLALSSAWWGSVAVCIALAAVVPLGIPFVFGQGFAPAVGPALLLLLGAPAVVLGYVGAQMLAAQNRARVLTIAQVVGVLTSVAAMFVLGSLHGAVGAAGGIVLGFVVTAAGVVIGSGVGLRFLLPNRRMVTTIVTMVVRGRLPEPAPA